MGVYTYQLYGRSQLAYLNERLLTIASLCLQEWGLEGEQLQLLSCSSDTVESIERFDVNGEYAVRYSPDHHTWVGIAADSASLAALAAYLLRDNRVGSRFAPSGSAISQELVRSLLKDLAGRLLSPPSRTEASASALQEDELAADWLAAIARPGQGLLCVEFRLAETVVHAYLPALLALELIDESDSLTVDHPIPAVAPLRQALGNQKVNLQIRLDGVELSLEALASLAVGDVIRLDQRLDDPCEVSFNDSSVKGRAFIGQHKGSLSIRLDSAAN